MAECEMSIASLSETNTIFEQPWWLDAVAPDAWDAVQVSKGGEIVARLPYVVKQKRGLTALSMPPLTLTLGPWLKPSTAKYANQLSQQKELMTSLIEQLPPHDYFSQYFHHSVSNWLPFYWQGFEQTTRYTYVIEALEDLERVWDQLSKTVRRKIRKAQKQLAVRTDVEDIERFFDVNALTFKRQGLDVPYSRDVVRRLDAACTKHQASRMFFAEDAQGRIHSAQYFVWDGNSAYALMGGSDPDLRSSDAHSLLMWEGIRFAATVAKEFNFGGSMMESIERYVRDFGGVQKPYFHLTRFSRRMRFLVAGRGMIGTLLGSSR
jgi:lipid II:glycine glycyltransferase (peptidoglycan interpeptide bridge formation enzyme)